MSVEDIQVYEYRIFKHRAQNILNNIGPLGKMAWISSKKVPLLLPDTPTGHLIAGYFLMLGIDANHHILSPGEPIRLHQPSLDKNIAYRPNRPQLKGLCFLAGISPMDLHIQELHDAHRFKDVLELRWRTKNAD